MAVRQWPWVKCRESMAVANGGESMAVRQWRPDWKPLWCCCLDLPRPDPGLRHSRTAVHSRPLTHGFNSRPFTHSCSLTAIHVRPFMHGHWPFAHGPSLRLPLSTFSAARAAPPINLAPSSKGKPLEGWARPPARASRWKGPHHISARQENDSAAAE